MASETINSSAYVLGITKATVMQSVYKLFYNRIHNGVTDTHSSARSKWWYSAWPDADIVTSDSYPIGIIESPDIEWDKVTLTKKKSMITIDVTVHHTHAGELDSLAQQVINAIESSRITFRSINIKFVNLIGTTGDTVMRDKIIVHSKTMSFECEFNFAVSLT